MGGEDWAIRPLLSPPPHELLVDRSSPCLQRSWDGDNGWTQLPGKSKALGSLSLPEDGVQSLKISHVTWVGRTEL